MIILFDALSVSVPSFSSYRQRRRAVVLHGDREFVLLLALPVGRRRPCHHLSGDPVHAEGQVLVPGRDVVEQHGVGADVSVGGHHAQDGRAASDVLRCGNEKKREVRKAINT